MSHPKGTSSAAAQGESEATPGSKTVAFLLYDRIEELDLVGPLEVFGVAGRLQKGSFRVITVSHLGRRIHGRYGLRIVPQYDFDECPSFDILVVPGGPGTAEAVKDPAVLSFVRKAGSRCLYVCSVCTGAIVLASAGLLDGKRATTHWADLSELQSFPQIMVDHQRFIQDGNVITSAGISAGIDMALHVVELLHGESVKYEVTHRMEYTSSLPLQDKVPLGPKSEGVPPG